ncbi:hypothetical protein HAX54_006740 [Datura stramonium]|uniref:FRIGIDA-like protein n=1 Tax=Datura stramonium TaxID=4076 RepID=A0ABS8TAP2_DATST|nr:hypothetical protein [Datura stramonium]
MQYLTYVGGCAAADDRTVELQVLEVILSSFMQMHIVNESCIRDLSHFLQESDKNNLLIVDDESIEKRDDDSQLEALCKMMCKELRSCIGLQLAEKNKLREELPKALKLAPSATKLVLNYMGDFFAKRRKIFDKDARMISTREASASTLECFLLIDFDEIDEGVKEEATSSGDMEKKVG